MDSPSACFDLESSIVSAILQRHRPRILGAMPLAGYASTIAPVRLILFRYHHSSSSGPLIALTYNLGSAIRALFSAPASPALYGIRFQRP